MGLELLREERKVSEVSPWGPNTVSIYRAIWDLPEETAASSYNPTYFKTWAISELRMKDLVLNPEIDDYFFIYKVGIIMLSHRIVNGYKILNTEANL